VGERDRVVEHRREALLHSGQFATGASRLPAVFNFSGSEMVFLLLLALIILGPEKLPEAVRKFSQTYGEFKKAATGFQSELKSALDEPMKEMRATADELKKAASFDVMGGLTPDTKPPASTADTPAEPAGDAPPTLSPFQSTDPVSAAPPIRSAPPTITLPPEPVVEVVEALPVVAATMSADEAVPEPIIPEPVVPDPEPIIPEPIIPEPVVPDPEPIIPEPIIPEPVVPDPEPVIPEPVLPAAPSASTPLPLTRVLAARPAPAAPVVPPPPADSAPSLPLAPSLPPSPSLPPAPSGLGDAPPFAAPAWPQPVVSPDEGSSPA
jgi:sec-independent protein translocase protein TatB